MPNTGPLIEEIERAVATRLSEMTGQPEAVFLLPQGWELGPHGWTKPGSIVRLWRWLTRGRRARADVRAAERLLGIEERG